VWALNAIVSAGVGQAAQLVFYGFLSCIQRLWGHPAWVSVPASVQTSVVPLVDAVRAHRTWHVHLLRRSATAVAVCLVGAAFHNVSWSAETSTILCHHIEYFDMPDISVGNDRRKEHSVWPSSEWSDDWMQRVFKQVQLLRQSTCSWYRTNGQKQSPSPPAGRNLVPSRLCACIGALCFTSYIVQGCVLDCERETSADTRTR
jgi:hypothetical protein